MTNYIKFRYNANNFNTRSYQYGSDQNSNVSSKIVISSYDLYDSDNINIGFIEFIDNSVSTKSNTNFQNSTQLYNETGSFFVEDKGTITYNISFVSDSVDFSQGQVVPTIISATGIYYDKVDKIAIDCFKNGDRVVWITFK